MTQKEDGGTVAMAEESTEDNAFGLVSNPDRAPSTDCSSISSGGSAEWSLVVNGTRYFGHLRPEMRFVIMEGMDDAVGLSPRETTK